MFDPATATGSNHVFLHCGALLQRINDLRRLSQRVSVGTETLGSEQALVPRWVARFLPL